MFTSGTIITLEDRDFLCVDQITVDGHNYYYLISTGEPMEVCFAEPATNDDPSQLRIIGNQDEKSKVFSALQAKLQTLQAEAKR